MNRIDRPTQAALPVATRLPERGGVDVRGDERVRWLDGMVTQDVVPLSPGAFAPTLILTHQGRIVSDAFLWVFEDRIRLDLERAAAAPLIEHLDRLIIADDVTLSDVSEAGGRLTIEGDGARAAVQAAAGVSLDTIATASLGGVDGVVLAAHALIEAEGVQVLAPAGATDAVLQALLAAEGIAPGSASALEIRRIERGVPRYGNELDATVLPAETRLDRAISTTKGCYAGQEVVARMRSRGQVSSLLVALRFEAEPPAPGARITVAGKKVGELTSTALSQTLGAIGLGYVKTAHAQPGTRVEADGAPAVVAAPSTD